MSLCIFGGCEQFIATMGKCLTRLVIWLTNLKQRFARRIGRQEGPQVNPRSTIHPGLHPSPRSRIIARFFSRPKVSSAATTPAAPPAPRDLPLAGASGSKQLPPLDTPRDLPDTPRIFERVPLPGIPQNVDTSLTDEAGLSYRHSSVKLVNSILLCILVYFIHYYVHYSIYLQTPTTDDAPIIVQPILHDLPASVHLAEIHESREHSPPKKVQVMLKEEVSLLASSKPSVPMPEPLLPGQVEDDPPPA